MFTHSAFGKLQDAAKNDSKVDPTFGFVDSLKKSALGVMLGASLALSQPMMAYSIENFENTQNQANVEQVQSGEEDSDPFRETLLRYWGYANEVGESFAAQAP